MAYENGMEGKAKSSGLHKGMRRFLWAIASIQLLVSTVFGPITFVSASGTTYYVSAAGNDANNGTSTATPWKTLTKVNNVNFTAGDQILFKAGDVWSGKLVINDSGSSGNPIKVGVYGTGSRPLINGSGGEAGLLITGASYVTVEGMAVTNYDGADIYDGAEGNRDGIKISGASSNIVIRNNEIYYVEGFSNHSSVGSPRGTTLDPNANHTYIVGAIFQSGTPASNLTIEGNYIHDNTCTGILTTQLTSGLIIQSNTVSNVGSDGIEYWNSQSPLVQYNSVSYAGNNSGTAARGTGVLGYNGLAVVGLWGLKTTGQTAQYNYVGNTKRIRYDGQAWDFDIDTSGGVYQYNFSRDNEGGFSLGGKPDQIYRYNISYNDGSSQRSDQGFFNANSIYYNNVFYQNNGAGFSKSHLTSATFTNNIFYTNSTNTSYTDYQSSGLTFSNNCYGGTQTALNKGTNPVTGDPLFVNPASVGYTAYSVDGFKLQSSSPCLNAGLAISGNGGKDYWGNPLYNGAPDIGAFEAPTVPTGNTHGGTWVMKQAATGTPTYTGPYQVVSGIPANSTYVFKAWIKGNGQKGRLVVYNSTWGMIIQTPVYTSNGSWVEVGTPFFNTGANTTLIVQFIDMSTLAGETFIDDTFFGWPGGANKLNNAGFESGNTGWVMGSPYTIVQP